jgi:hypothetical protein
VAVFFLLCPPALETLGSCPFLSAVQHQEVTEQQKPRFSYIFFCLLMEGSGSGAVKIITDPDPGGSRTYLSRFLPSTNIKKHW